MGARAEHFLVLRGAAPLLGQLYLLIRDFEHRATPPPVAFHCRLRLLLQVEDLHEYKVAGVAVLGAGEAQRSKILDGAAGRAAVHELPRRHDDEIVNHVKYFGGGLVQRGDHRFAFAGERLEGRHHVVSVQCVETRGGLVQEKQRRV